MADSQEDYPDSGDINITNTGVEKLLKNKSTEDQWYSKNSPLKSHPS